MMKYIEEFSNPRSLTIQSLADAFNISERTIHRAFSSSNDLVGGRGPPAKAGEVEE